MSKYQFVFIHLRLNNLSQLSFMVLIKDAIICGHPFLISASSDYLTTKSTTYILYTTLLLLLINFHAPNHFLSSFLFVNWTAMTKNSSFTFKISKLVVNINTMNIIILSHPFQSPNFVISPLQLCFPLLHNHPIIYYILDYTNMITCNWIM